MTAQTLPATEAATPKIQYRVTNWPEYDRALVERGSLTIWFDDEFLQSHWRPGPQDSGLNVVQFKHGIGWIGHVVFPSDHLGNMSCTCARSCQFEENPNDATHQMH